MDMVWISPPDLEELALEVTVNSGLGVIVIQERPEDAPKLIFCSLFRDPTAFFQYPSDRRDVGLTIDEMRDILSKIEAKIASRPFASKPNP